MIFREYLPIFILVNLTFLQATSDMPDLSTKLPTVLIYLMLNADVFLTNSSALLNLVHKRHTVVAPLLKSDGMYSNFWAAMMPEHF
ncbi:hypothetical protein PUN28_000913 [Cardiocondyla obscurior]|uniref:Uncharacterized protein n=1 Tax=Cardiocondyla obscurior TaxID=286306 RepID=A0AAW2H2A5_9HYME